MKKLNIITAKEFKKEKDKYQYEVDTEALNFMATWQNKYINLLKVKGLTQTTSDHDLVKAGPALLK